MNPLYKHIFDKLDALAVKRLYALDKSVLWSRHFKKRDFYITFLYPLIAFVLIILASVNYGLRNRLYIQHIKHGRQLELGNKMGIDFDDIENYPASVMPIYFDKKKQVAYLKNKEDNMTKVENNFHKMVE